MNQIADSTFVIQQWDEEPFDEAESPKVTQAFVVKQYRGTMAGVGTTRQWMIYVEDGTATFTGLERFVGQIDGREGSFLLRHEGRFEAGVVDARWEIVEGSGSEALSGISGQILFRAGHQDEYPVELVYTLEAK